MAQSGDEALGVKDGFAFEHEINGARELNGDDGVGLEFIPTHARFKFLRERPDDFVIALGDARGFAKSPTEIRITQLGATKTFDLADGSHGAFDEAANKTESFSRCGSD